MTTRAYSNEKTTTEIGNEEHRSIDLYYCQRNFYVSNLSKIFVWYFEIDIEEKERVIRLGYYYIESFDIIMNREDVE